MMGGLKMYLTDSYLDYWYNVHETQIKYIGENQVSGDMLWINFTLYYVPGLLGRDLRTERSM